MSRTVRNINGYTLDTERRINLGDRVRVEFGRDKNDLLGDVIYIPTQPGDVWIILTENRLNYILEYSVISKQLA